MDQTGEASGHKASAEERASAHAMLTMLKESQAIVQYQHVKDQLAAMLALSRYAGGLQGRKAAIVFSRGLSSTARDRMTLLSMVATANRSGLSIWSQRKSVDPSGELGHDEFVRHSERPHVERRHVEYGHVEQRLGTRQQRERW